MSAIILAYEESCNSSLLNSENLQMENESNF